MLSLGNLGKIISRNPRKWALNIPVTKHCFFFRGGPPSQWEWGTGWWRPSWAPGASASYTCGEIESQTRYLHFKPINCRYMLKFNRLPHVYLEKSLSVRRKALKTFFCSCLAVVDYILLILRIKVLDLSIGLKYSTF